MNRSKLDALEISIDGLLVCRVSSVAARPVAAGPEELIQDVVFIGGEYQFFDRQPHHARHVPGADIAEITRRHGKRYLLGI